jgi:hypothetical protein
MASVVQIILPTYNKRFLEQGVEFWGRRLFELNTRIRCTVTIWNGHTSELEEIHHWIDSEKEVRPYVGIWSTRA